MDEMKLRGYVSPEDFSGSDTEKIQQAISVAHEKDINKVIISGNYTVDKTVFIFPLMHILLDSATVKCSGDFPLFCNYGKMAYENAYSFEEDLFCINGEGTLEGDLQFVNAKRITIENLKIKGKLYFDFVRQSRIEYCEFEGENAIVLGTGCNNFIIQHIKAKTSGTAIVLDTALMECGYCIGKEPEIHDMIIRCGEFCTEAPAITLDATDEYGIFNVQTDEHKACKTGVLIGSKSGELDAQQYFNLTVYDIDTEKPYEVLSPVKNCLIK